MYNLHLILFFKKNINKIPLVNEFGNYLEFYCLKDDKLFDQNYIAVRKKIIDLAQSLKESNLDEKDIFLKVQEMKRDSIKEYKIRRFNNDEEFEMIKAFEKERVKWQKENIREYEFLIKSIREKNVYLLVIFTLFISIILIIFYRR